MFENLLNLVKENAGEAIVNNPAIPNEHNDAAISQTATGIMDALKSQIASGKGADVAGLLSSSGNISSNPMVTNIVQSVAGNLMTKFGLDATAANGIVASMVPNVLNSLTKKTNDPNDKSFDLQGILSSVGGGNIDVAGLIGQVAGGGKAGGIAGLIGKLFGK
ncbi:MAG: hypothetical protein ABL940_09320 [Bacteroidia bacterium]